MISYTEKTHSIFAMWEPSFPLSFHPMHATTWIQILWHRSKDPRSAMYICISRKDRNLLLAILPINGPSSNSASTKTMLYSLRQLSWVLQWSRHRSCQGDYSAYEKQPFKFQTIWSQITLVHYCTTVLVLYVFRWEFFQLTFHLVQYKIFHNVAVKVQLVCNCTSNLGQIKAQKVVFFFSPHM